MTKTYEELQQSIIIMLYLKLSKCNFEVLKSIDDEDLVQAMIALSIDKLEENSKELTIDELKAYVMEIENEYKEPKLKKSFQERLEEMQNARNNQSK